MTSNESTDKPCHLKRYIIGTILTAILAATAVSIIAVWIVIDLKEDDYVSENYKYINCTIIDTAIGKYGEFVYIVETKYGIYSINSWDAYATGSTVKCGYLDGEVYYYKPRYFNIEEIIINGILIGIVLALCICLAWTCVCAHC